MHSHYISCFWLGAFTFSNYFVLQAAFGGSYTFFGFVVFKELFAISNVLFAQFLLLFFLFSHGFLLNFLHDLLHVFFANARFFAVAHISQCQCQRVRLDGQTTVLQVLTQVLTNDVVGFLFQRCQLRAVINWFCFFFITANQACSRSHQANNQ